MLNGEFFLITYATIGMICCSAAIAQIRDEKSILADATGLALASDSGAQNAPSGSQPDPHANEPSPRPVKPPRSSTERGFRFALVGGMIIPIGKYQYDTTVDVADAGRFRYSGSQASLGLILAIGGEVSLPGALRRITLGSLFGESGYATSATRTLPQQQSSLPFSTDNLSQQVQQAEEKKQSNLFTVWSAAVSPYIESDVWVHRGKDTTRFRAGYEYWRRQVSTLDGTFAASDAVQGNFNIRYTAPANHMLRLSIDTLEKGARTGGLGQVTVLVGQHRTVIFSMNAGGFLRTRAKQPLVPYRQTTGLSQ